MRVALQIDGDSSGAEKATSDTVKAVEDLGKETEAITKAIEDGFNKAAASVEKLAGSTQAAGAANDNVTGSALALAGKLSEVASKAAGANSAIAVGANGAFNFAKGIGEVAKSAGAFGIIGAAVGVAQTAATTFYAIVNAGAAEQAKRLDENARLVGVVRDAYRDAGKAAGEFYNQSKNVTALQLQQNLLALKGDQRKAAQGALGQFQFDSTIAGISQSNNPFGNVDDSEVRNFEALKAAADGLSASIAAGNPDIKKYQETIANIGLAAQGVNPALAKAAAALLEQSKSAADLTDKVLQTEAAIAVLNGTATETQKKMIGVTVSTNDNVGAFERLTKSMSRQAAAQEAEAQTTGLAAGEAARLRTEFVLTEAAQQAGIKVAGDYANTIKQIADRAGEASQKLALSRLQSDTAFNKDQIGRNTIDASVADQLKGAFGTSADQNSPEANAIRLNETMKELKATTTDVATSGFRDLRSELMNGASAFDALGKAGLNAIGNIADKLASKALENGISNLFGSLLGVGGTGTVANGGIVLGDAAGPGVFKAANGGTFGPGWGIVGEEGPEIIKVHNAGVTVYPHHVSKPYLPGFADGGSLSPSGNVQRLPIPIRSQDNSPQQLHVSVGVSVDDDGKLQAYVKDISQETSSNTVASFVSSRAFVGHVAAASTKAAKSGLS